MKKKPNIMTKKMFAATHYGAHSLMSMHSNPFWRSIEIERINC